jgi:hypothetical protein
MEKDLELRLAYTVRLNANGKGSIEYIYEGEEKNQ